MHTNTLRAIEKLATETGMETVIEDDQVTVTDSCMSLTIEAHKVDGGWIIAHWNKLHSQWQSSDVKGQEQSFCYAYARTLQGLADYGVTTYRSPTEAIRSYLRAVYY